MDEISRCSFVPQLQPGSCILPSVFSLVRPHIDFSFHGILSHINTVFVLRSKVNVCLLIPTHSPGGENHPNGPKAPAKHVRSQTGSRFMSR